MKIVKISGGLGNQMLQYVYGQYLSKKYREKIYYDIEWYKKKRKKKNLYLRNFELAKFDIDIKIVKKKHLLKYNKFEKFIYLLKGLLLLDRNTFALVYDSRNTMFGSLLSKFSSLLSVMFKNSYHIGNWLDFKYYEYVSNEVEFKLNSNELLINKKIKNKILRTNAVSIGVRRGDYVKLGVACDIDYYKKAINLIKMKVYNPTYYIFSDDIEWCKKNISISTKHFFVEQNKEISFENMELMSLCKHNIISNSTYDWWGAMLNKTKQRIVISPKFWMPDDVKIRVNFIPNEWIKI
jgi:hypothetical protein